MATFLLHDSELTTDQRRVVELPTGRHHLILGPPGSGKTQVLLHRAKYLRDRLNSKSDRFRIFVFTNVLTYFIRASLDYLGLEAGTVMTFDSWCVEFHERNVSRKLPKRETMVRGRKRWEYDYSAIRQGVLQSLQQRSDLRGQLDFALVDEGQDLDATCYELLKLAARHLTVFADSRQQIYENGIDETSIRDRLGLVHHSASLLSAYRNSPDVANLAGYFIAEDDKRSSYLAEIKNFRSARETPSLYLARDWDDEMDHLAEVLRQRQNLNQKACIIVPTNFDLGSVANQLAERGVAVERAAPPKTRSTPPPAPPNFENSIPKIATFHSAKGLTFDCVLLPKLVETNFRRFVGKQRQRMLLVGITRATQWVYLSTVAGYEIGEIKALRQAGANGHLFIKEFGPPGTAVKSAAAPSNDDQDDSSFL